MLKNEDYSYLYKIGAALGRATDQGLIQEAAEAIQMAVGPAEKQTILAEIMEGLRNYSDGMDHYTAIRNSILEESMRVYALSQ